MATSSLQPHSSNPFRDPNRSPTITPQATGASTHSHNPFLSPVERVTPQATGGSQYFTPQPTGAGALGFTPPAIGALTPQATGVLAFSTPPTAPLETQNTGTHPTSSPPPVPQTSTRPSPSKGYASPAGPPPSQNTPSPTPDPMLATTSTSGFAPPPGSPPQRSTYAPPPGPPPPSQSAPRAPSPAPTIVAEPPPPYTPAADVRQGEVPLETGPRRAYAPEWHPDGQVWRNEAALAAAGNSPSPGREEPQSRPNVVVSQPTGSGSSSWSAYPGQNRPPPRHPTLSSSPTLGRSNTTVGTSSVSRAQPGPPTTVPTPGRALLNQGKVLAYPAMYECDKCHLTGYVAYDPSNPCRQCWSLFAQPYEGALTYAPWDSPEDVTSDQQNLQRPLPGASARPPPSAPGPSSRPLSHPQHSSYAGLGHPPGSLPPADWSRPSASTSLRPSASMSYPSRPSFPGRPSGISYAGRPPPGALVVRPGDPRIGGRVCWKCSGDGWQYKSLGLETKTCSACNGLGRLF